MITQLRWDDFDPRKTFVIGQEYWAYIVEVNSKSTGLLRNVKPFSLSLIKLDNSYYVNNGHSDYWDWACYEWDFSKCPKKMSQPEAELYYNGFVCTTKEECIESYNKFLDTSVKSMRYQLSKKYNKEYIKTKTDNLLKNKIK